MSWPIRSVLPSEPAWEVEPAAPRRTAPRVDVPAPRLPDEPLRGAQPTTGVADPGPAADTVVATDTLAATETVAATAHAEAATRRVLTRVLEALDGRRSPETLVDALDAGVLDMVRDLCRKRRGLVGQAGSRLRTVTLCRTALPGRTTTVAHTSTYEVCATYARGPRLFAVAARFRVAPDEVRCLALRMLH